MENVLRLLAWFFFFFFFGWVVVGGGVFLWFFSFDLALFLSLFCLFGIRKYPPPPSLTSFLFFSFLFFSPQINRLPLPLHPPIKEEPLGIFHNREV